jgi:chromate transporter
VPGPGSTFVEAIGFKAAGVGGALVSLMAIYVPAAVLAYVVGSRWDSLRNWRWHEAIQRGLTPVVAGLLIAASYFLLRATVTNLATATIAAAATVLLLSRRANPMLIVLGGGVAGWLLYH